MKSVLKYKLDIDTCLSFGNVLEIPKNSKILDIQYQDKNIVMWCLVDLQFEHEKVKRVFEIYGTGDIVAEKNYKYLKTLQSETSYIVGSGLVWHIFEKIK